MEIFIYIQYLFYFTDNFVTNVNYLASNITFVNNYNDLKASNQLEIKRAMIYNYLLSIGMPLISDVVLKEGISLEKTIAYIRFFHIF